ncbi:MAG: PAS domain S-box protein [Nitrospiraceae bacterium]
MPDRNASVILNVERNEATRSAKTRILRRAGYRVVEAADGTEALRLAREARPRLVILDAGLPGVSGVEVCRSIKTDPATARIIILQIAAASAPRLDRVPGLDDADMFLTEPVEADELLAAVRSLLRLRQREADNRRLLNEMADRERFIRSLIDAAPCTFYLYDIRQKRNLYMNPPSGRTLGYRPEEMARMSDDLLRRLAHPEDLPGLLATLESFSGDAAGDALEFECRFKHKNNEWRWFMTRNVVFKRDESGRALEVLGIGQEITERKRMEETVRANETRLLRSEQQFQDAMEAAHCGMWDWDITSGRLDWLGAHERLAGLRPGSFTGKFDDFVNVLHPDDRPRVRHDLQAAMERRDTRYADEYRYVLPDGTIRWMAGTGQFYYDDAGRPVRMTGVVQDIHDRRSSEERLQNKTARLALLAEAAERLLTQECSAKTMEELYGVLAPHLGLDSYWDYDRDEGGEGLRLTSSAGISAETAPAFEYLRFGEALCGTCAQARTPIIMERLQESNDPKAALVKRNGHRAYACYPLIVEEQFLGTLGFASRRREAFEREEIEFLGTIAHYVGMVKARRRAETRLLKRNQRSELLARAEGTLLVAQDSTAMMQSLFEMMREHLRLDGYLNYTVDEHEPVMLLDGSAGIPAEALPPFQCFTPGEGPIGTAWQRREPVIIEQAEQSVDPYGDRLVRLGFRTYACHPLMAGDRCFGILAFGSKSKARFDADDTDLMRTLCRYAAMAKERLRLVAEVRRREHMLLRAQRAAKAGLWEVDLRTGRLSWSDAYYELFGLDRGTRPALGDWLARVHPDDREIMRARHDQIMTDRQDHDLEYRMQLPDGTVRWVQRKGQIDRDEQGRPVRLSGITFDITERKRGEETLRASEERWQLAVNGTTDGMWDWDPRSNKIFLSNRWKALRGYGEDEIGDDAAEWFSRIHPDDVERVMRTLQLYFSKRIPVYECEYRSRCKDGEYRWIQDRGQAVWDEQERVVRMVGSGVDITARRRADERIAELNRELGLRAQELQILVGRLRENEARIKLITDSLPILIAYVDADQRYRFNNLSYERWFGRPLEQITGRAIRDIVGAAAYEQLKPYVDLALSGEPQHFEAQVRYEQLGPRHVDVTYMPDRAASGKVRGFILMVNDVTERRLIEEAFKDQLNLVNTITDNTPSCLLMMDAQGIGTFANPATELITGYKTDELIGKKLSEVIRHKRADRSPFQAGSSSDPALRSPESIQGYEDEFLHKNGRAYPVRCAVRSILKDGTTIGAVLEIQDITKEKRAEQALREREEQLRVITDSVPSLIAYVDRDERYRFVNAGYDAAFRRPRHNILGRSIRELAGEGYEELRPFIARVLAGEAVSFESRMTREAENATALASYTPDVKPDGSVAGFYIMVTDISDRKRAEEALREFNIELEQRVNQRTQELVGSQARLRALATELNLSEQRQRRRLSEDLHDYLAQLLVFVRLKLNQAKRSGLAASSMEFIAEADSTLSQALTYTRSLIAELSPPVLRDFGLVVALQWLADQMRRHELKVSLESCVKEVAIPEEQAVLLFQSVRELLINVSKHAGTDRAVVTVGEGDGMLWIEVKDEGKGFDLDQAQAADNTVSAASHYGLFSIRERMCAMGGDFDLNAEPGRGTRAMLVLPLTPQPANEKLGMLNDESANGTAITAGESRLGNTMVMSPHTAAVDGDTRTLHPDDSTFHIRPPSFPPRAPVRVLLADDHAMLRQGLRSVLHAYADVEIVGEASDGEQALLLAQSLQPEVVVMDVNMPGVDGIEATRQLRQEQPTIAVVGLSVHNNPQIERAMRDAGAAGFLTKDSAVEQLYVAIQEALGQDKYK